MQFISLILPALAVAQTTPFGMLSDGLLANTTYSAQDIEVKDNQLGLLPLPDAKCTGAFQLYALLGKRTAGSSIYPKITGGQKGKRLHYAPKEENTVGDVANFLSAGGDFLKKYQSSITNLQANADYVLQEYTIEEHAGSFSTDLSDNIAVYLSGNATKDSGVFFVPSEVSGTDVAYSIVTMTATCGDQHFVKTYKVKTTNNAHANSFAFATVLIASVAYALL